MRRGEPFPIVGRIGFVRTVRGSAAERLLHTLARPGLPVSIRLLGRACFLSFARLRVGLRVAGRFVGTGSGRALSPIVRAHGARPGKTGKTRSMGRTPHRRR